MDQHHSNKYEDLENSDKILFVDYIMSIRVPKGFKPPTDVEPYKGSTDPQEHIDAFKSRITLVRASNPIKCRAFLITLKKTTFKGFNLLALK